MPKIIAHLKEDILASARRRLTESGREGLTISAVAADCGVAVGTIYNYFESKDMLMASVIVDDWRATLERLRGECETAETVTAGLERIHRAIADFTASYTQIFRPDTTPSPRFAFRDRHALLRSQLAALIAALRARFGTEKDELLDTFLADSLLAWGSEGVDFASLAPIYARLTDDAR